MRLERADEILLEKPNKALDGIAGFRPNATGTTNRGDTNMKIGIISFITTLLLALPALAGPADPCDGDGVGPPQVPKQWT